MVSSRWFALAVSGAVLVAGLAARPALANEVGKEVVCPVMGATFKVAKDTKSSLVNGKPVYFCCAGCPEEFAKNPEKYAAKIADLGCPVMVGTPSKPNKSLRVLVNDSVVYLCCGGCPAMFTDAPHKYITYELKDPVTGKMFKVASGQPRTEYKGRLYIFADKTSQDAFLKDSAKYAIPTN